MNDKEIRLFLKNHIRFSIWFEEFEVAGRRIDMYNFSTGVAYEIKSSKDTLDRLDNQLEKFKQFFKRLYVVTDDSNKLKILKEKLENTNVGILFIENDKLKTIKKHINNNDTKNILWSEIDKRLFDIIKDDPIRALIFIKKQFSENQTEQKSKEYKSIK